MVPTLLSICAAGLFRPDIALLGARLEFADTVHHCKTNTCPSSKQDQRLDQQKALMEGKTGAIYWAIEALTCKY
jgi:hypothetical protein